MSMLLRKTNSETEPHFRSSFNKVIGSSMASSSDVQPP